jgi:hypothetical protein
MNSISHTTLFSAREIAHLLHGNRCGSGYIARCPAHDDRTPSLSLCDASDGMVLVHCHTGCSQEAVLDALRSKGLWPERSERRWLTHAEWQEQRRYAAEMRERIRASRYWALAIAPLLEALLEELPPIDELDWLLGDDEITERAAITRALMEVRAAREDPLLLAALYADWRKREPKLTAGLAYAGKQSERRWAGRIWRWIDGQSR